MAIGKVIFSHALTGSPREPLRVPITKSALATVLALTVQATALAQTARSDESNTETSALEEVVVTGIRESLDSAQEIKRNSSQIVDSIVSDDIGKLPDRSVTEALQRIPGVTIDHFMQRNDPDHFSVEGSGVNIRGLTFVRSELNGRDVFTANGGRTLSFEDVPPELLGGVDVYKSQSADLVEGGVAGVVNLRTLLPFDNKERLISSSLQYTYGDLREEGKPSASVLYSDRWNTDAGEIGFLMDVAYSQQSTRTDGIQVEPFYPRTDLEPGRTVYLPKGANWRTLLFERKRLGSYAALQWAPTDTSEFHIQYFRSQYKMHWDENAIFSQTNAYSVVPAAGTSFTYDANGVFQSGLQTNPTDRGMPFNDDVRSADRKSVTSDISLAGKWDVNDRLQLRTEFQYVKGTTTGFDSTVATGVNLPSMNLDLTSGTPQISVPEEFMTNPNNYYWAFTMDKLDDNVGTEKSWRSDLELSFGNDFFRSVVVGLRYADRNVENKNSPYNWQAVSQQWQTPGYLPRLASLQEFSPEASSLYTFPNFYRGAANLPSSVIFPNVSQATGYPDTYQALQAIRQKLCKELDPNCVWQWQPAQFGPQQINNQQEKTYATYAMMKFGSDDAAIPYSGNFGARVVKTDNVADGNIVFPTALTPPPNSSADYPTFDGSTIPIAADNSYTDVLPSLNFTARFTPELQGRLGISKAIARPDFEDSQAYTQLSASIDQNTGVLSLTSSNNTNPNLRPMRANQIDTSLEWYFQQAGSVTGALFYKQLKDVVRTSVFSEQYDGLNYAVTRPQNVGGGVVKGAELAWQQFFNFLPGRWSGFGAAVNYTRVYSATGKDQSGLVPGSTGFLSTNGVDTDGTIFGSLPLEGLSKNSYNVTTFYEQGPLQVRLAYNWRSKYLLAVNVNGTNGTDGSPLNPNGVRCGTTPNDHCVAWGLPTYNDDYGQLDGSVFYKLTERVSFGLEAQNISNAENRVLMQQNGPGTQTRAWFISDRRFTAQIRTTF